MPRKGGFLLVGGMARELPSGGGEIFTVPLRGRGRMPTCESPNGGGAVRLVKRRIDHER